LSLTGIKHTVKCRCILSQFKNRENPPLHEFVVFSVMDGDDLKKSHAKCNNCGITHEITDLCKSKILDKSDDWSVPTKEEISYSFSPDLKDLLKSYEADLPTWQMSQWIIDNNKWGSKIILSKKDLDDRIEGKILIFKEKNLFRIETFLESK